MLPFLKNKTKQGEAGLTIKVRIPDEQENQENSNENEGLEAAARDIISAVHMKNHTALAEALKAAFDICDSMPHEEGEHTNETEPHSYEANKED